MNQCLLLKPQKQGDNNYVDDRTAADRSSNVLRQMIWAFNWISLEKSGSIPLVDNLMTICKHITSFKIQFNKGNH